MGGWKIPERQPLSTSFARMEELRDSTESHIASQHVVSRAILKEFATPAAGSRGWTLIPYDVKLRKHKRPLGLKGCGKFLNFLIVATASAEQMWAEVERDIPAMVAAARAGTIHQDPALVSVARDCLAVHLVRSPRYMAAHTDAVRKTLEGFKEFALEKWRQRLIGAYIAKYGGILPVSRESLGALIDPAIEDWQRLDSSGLMARADIEFMFHRVRETFAQVNVQVWHAPVGGEFLISDSPCFTLRYSDDGKPAKPHVAIGDSHTVAMPIARDCYLALGPVAQDDVLLSDNVRLFNELQMDSAFGHLYYRPGSNIGSSVDAFFLKSRSTRA
jgi:hypothetical protein